MPTCICNHGALGNQDVYLNRKVHAPSNQSSVPNGLGDFPIALLPYELDLLVNDSFTFDNKS